MDDTWKESINYLVAVPTDADLDAIQNENFFEGDIAGIPVDGGSVRLADAPYDVFSEPVTCWRFLRPQRK